jgi:hypothetical protein
MKQRKTVRVAGPFSVEALIETYPDNTSRVLGYNIRGPGSDPPLSSPSSSSANNVGQTTDPVIHVF